MSSRPDKEMEERLTAAGISHLQIPLLSDELLALLDQIEDLLPEVEQSPSRSMQTALSPLMKALVVEELLKNSYVDVKAGIACCISEIIRITAPIAPYDDNIMKDVFQLIVSSFENLSDMSSRSYDKRTAILEIVARYDFCFIMLHIECHQIIIEMFRHFLNAIRVNHPEDVFGSMEKIMTRFLEENEDICPDLLIPILDTLKMNNEDVLPVARKLAERVIQNSAGRVRPYMAETVKKIDADFDDFGKVVASVCRESTDIVSISRDKLDKVKPQETTRMCSRGKLTPGTVKDAVVKRSCHDTSSNAQWKKKKERNTNSESSKSSKRQKIKLKDTATKFGEKSKDDGKPESEIKGNNSKGKSQGDSGKASGGKLGAILKINNSRPDNNYVDDAAIKSQKVGGESQNGKSLTITSSSPIMKESETTLLKTTPSSKVGEGNSMWPTEGTLLPQASQSTLRHLSRMLNEGIQTDVTIITSDGSLKAHKSILSISSPVFHSMFQDDLREKVSTVEMKEMTSESCMALLSFLYGSLNQEAFCRHRLDLLGAASKYDIVDLKDACEESLLEDINSGNVLERLEKACLYQLDELKKWCFTYLVDLEKIYDVGVVKINEFFGQADRRLLAEMFLEVLAALERS